ncbi:MAG: peptide chain release factor N(5)-glutamine methyltransferase [Rudaea sp.]
MPTPPGGTGTHDASASRAAARRETELLLQFALGVGRAWLFAHDDDAVAAEPEVAFIRLLARRAAGEPLAYLTGRREFFSLDLAVTPDVLIPRPETELLVDLALDRLSDDEVVHVADLGTGSGAIALAIARARPHARVLATDASDAALQVARANAHELGTRNIAFARGSWCAPLADRGFDVIVSNPPYIAAGDPHLARGDLRFEPASALASGADGLDAIRAIVREARLHLKAQGWLLFEHGHDQGHAARDLLVAAGYREIFTANDLEGRERVSGGRVA